MRTTEKISILTVVLLLFVSFSSFGQSRQDKTNAIINKLYLAQHQRMIYEFQVKPLKYHATGNDSVKLVELEKQLTDEHITKIISKSFDELLNDEEVNNLYNFMQSSVFEKFFKSGEIVNAVSVRLGMFDEDIKKGTNNLKDAMAKSVSTFAPIPIDREDGFYSAIDYDRTTKDKDIKLEEKPSLTLKDILEVEKRDKINNIQEINILFTKEGAKKFYLFTKDNIRKPIAVVIAKQIVTMPYPNVGIMGGRFSITGEFTDDEVDKMIERLKANSQ